MKSQPEKLIENAVIQFLQAKKYLVLKHQRMGVWDAGQKIYRKDRNPLHRDSEGMADLQFMLPKTLYFNSARHEAELNYVIPVFLEVKTKTGRQSPAQIEFQKKVEKAGAIYRVVQSIDDVQKLLEELNSTNGFFR